MRCFPKWLTIDLGYGAENMINGSEDVYVINSGNTTTTYEAYRQYYLSFGIDFSKIPVKSKFLKLIPLKETKSLRNFIRS